VPRVALAVLAAGVVTQVVWFEHWFGVNGPNRTLFFEAEVPALVQQAFANGATVYIDYDDRYAQTQAEWYVVSHHLPRERVPPPQSIVLGRFQECDYTCTRLAEADTYWIARSS
jgi:hypothetical protein